MTLLLKFLIRAYEARCRVEGYFEGDSGGVLNWEPMILPRKRFLISSCQLCIRGLSNPRRKMCNTHHASLTFEGSFAKRSTFFWKLIYVVSYAFRRQVALF